MECRYCKEEIKQGAVKCKNCGEFLKVRIKPGAVLRALFQILIPVLSLGLAYLEYNRANLEYNRANSEYERANIESQNRRNAEIAAREAEIVAQEAREETRQTMAILETMPKGIVLEIALSEFERELRLGEPGFHEIEMRRYAQAEKEFKKKIEENPEDEVARRGLIYAKVLKRPERK